MEDKIIHSLSLCIVNRLNRHAQREGNDYLKLVYGMEVMITNISKLIIVFLIAWLAGVLPYTLTLLVGFNSIRRAAHGAHASNGTACTVSSLTLFILVPYLLKGFVLSNLMVFLTFCVIIFMLFLYAPADTESRPLVGPKKRARLKKKAIISGIILMMGILLVRNGNIKTMLTLGAIYEAVSILPITYWILKKKYSNYEQYEGQVLAAKAM